MKKMTAILATVGLAATTLGSVSAKAWTTEPTMPTPISGNAWLHGEDSQLGAFRNQYYRLNAATKATVLTSKIKGQGWIKKSVTLPKGTVITGYRSGNHVKANVDDYSSISYGLKRAGLPAKNGANDGQVDFKVAKNRVTKIARPAYALTFGDNQFYRGGVKAIEQLPTRGSRMIKVTSDGYLEDYPYAPRVFTATDEYQGDYTWRIDHDAKPKTSLKITKATVKGANIQLYTKTKPSGVTSRRVAKTGRFQYRTTLTNRHRPCQFQDNRYGDDMAFASTYSIGKTAFYTVIGEGHN